MIAGRVLALSLALALPARGQSGAVSLLVIDDATDAAVADVRVSIVGQPGEGVTGPAGRFFYVSPRAGRVAFVLRRLGYVPGTVMVDVKTADTARVTFALTVAPQALATVAVRDTMRSASPFLGGFERRATTRDRDLPGAGDGARRVREHARDRALWVDHGLDSARHMTAPALGSAASPRQPLLPQ